MLLFIMNQFYTDESIFNLRPRDLYSENRLDFIDVGRIVYTIAAALNLRNDGYVHITFLRELLLREFLIASRLADGIAGGFRDIFRLFGDVVGGGGCGCGCGRGRGANSSGAILTQ
jgi:hypothetical protein